QAPAGLAVNGQGLSRPPRPLQRDHQLTSQALAERMPGDSRLQLAHQRSVPANSELSVHTFLEDRQALVLQTGNLRIQRRHMHVGQRVATPLSNSRSEMGRRRGGVTLARGSPTTIRLPAKDQQVQI